MLLCRTIQTGYRLTRCAISGPICAQAVPRCIEERSISPLWASLDGFFSTRDMATKPRRSTRNKEQAVEKLDAGSQVAIGAGS